jgi:hypothetical protein
MPGAIAAFQVGGVSIPANSTKDFTFPIVPLSVGEHVKASPLAPLDATWNGLIWRTFCSGVNQITVRVANVSAAPITPALQGFTFRSFYDPSL